ncbi:MAG: ornithine cyclodeaminase family protein [Actinobacteria bacterium]|nr:ornithine cyclodeaminase family protein [Actinomycetota bacterium]
MLVLSRSQIEALLETDALIDALATAMADLSAGHAAAPDRVAALVPEHDGLLAAMPGYLPAGPVLMTKLVSLFPRNAGSGLPTHQAVIAAFDPATGEPAALLDGTAITSLRTAACSALSARLLARPDADVLAIIGTGEQARSHARALRRVRPVREIRVAGRDYRKAAALAAELSGPDGPEVRAVPTYAEALDGAGIACATTHATEPVIHRSWLSPGVHVTSVGYNPAGREVDDATVRDALVCVESRAAALAPFPAGSNDLLQPIRDGVITAGHVHAELGELVAGTRPGRRSPEQITLYKSVGVAVQDAAAAGLVIAAARRRQAGQEITL